MLRDTHIREIMNKKVITLHIDEAFSHVEEKMRQNCIRHLPVVDDENKLLGIITIWDFYRAYTPHKTETGDYYDQEAMDRIILKHHMTPDPHTLRPDDKVAEAVQIMAEDKYSCIPIVDSENKLVGIVTQIDILRFVSSKLL
ncbi:MAG: hypothetical protein COV74_07170 [Candidatus Omnitrophica bacterium CG11_big_fil_rev_8_21_14_0_20_45_26]|uniref:CBS domain-containing protein n=1 Tax=Candidatus Abzuiibacterium crystallinum TaxID=1974748 RepID=A0A2H0LMY0_9BACT|nr:MAG: hypothetical protein COV74_07170 [Candidatus Omnitrophica bacterium CG11_big_fil_rev_8_21_14_0_20_45_26]PIW65483.1 MAG: hypothetical protein COW12_01430 [Candidatus Omnitrophica bacterium CG12_big_fil_rev_8_21_14_0_65_45_16]